MAQSLKKATGLTGLAVVPYPHRTLTVLYNKILKTLNLLPKEYPYRIYTEQLIKERADAVKNTCDVNALEEKICCGQIEEVIVQAENELRCLRNIIEQKAWEPLMEEAPKTQWMWPPHK